MTEAQKILRMIEEVDLKDAVTLDEIDVLVLEVVNANGILLHWNCGLKFTRSRDALKAVRPQNLRITAFNTNPKIDKNSHYCELGLRGEDGFDNLFHFFGQTEELAELHAIIQAIEYERGRK